MVIAHAAHIAALGRQFWSPLTRDLAVEQND
jgi:hypothetical protein